MPQSVKDAVPHRHLVSRCVRVRRPRRPRGRQICSTAVAPPLLPASRVSTCPHTVALAEQSVSALEGDSPKWPGRTRVYGITVFLEFALNNTSNHRSPQPKLFANINACPYQYLCLMPSLYLGHLQLRGSQAPERYTGTWYHCLCGSLVSQ